MKALFAALFLPFLLSSFPAHAAQPQKVCRVYEMDTNNRFTGRCVGEAGAPQLSISRNGWGYNDWVRHEDYCRAPNAQYVEACQVIDTDFAVCKAFENGVGFDDKSALNKMRKCFMENAWPDSVPERVAVHLGKLVGKMVANKTADELKKRYSPQEAAEMSAKATPFITKAFGLAAKGPLGKACAKKFERILEASVGNVGAVMVTFVDAAESFGSVVRLDKHQQCSEHRVQKSSNNTIVFAAPGSDEYKTRVSMCEGQSAVIDTAVEEKILSSMKDQYSCAER
jgi:hypothetical protein